MLTASQLAIVKADIAANPDLAAQVNNGDGNFEIARLYNLIVTTPAVFPVWRTDVPVQELFDAIDWTLYTPADAPDTTVTYTNRVMTIQVKQMNLQNILIGRQTIDSSKANIRKGLVDSTSNVRAGAGGANVDPGGQNPSLVMQTCVRNARRIEKVLAGANKTTSGVAAAVMGFTGDISQQDVQASRES